MATRPQTRSFKDKLAQIPVVGYVLRTGLAIITLPRRLDALHVATYDAQQDVERLAKSLELTNEDLKKYVRRAQTNEQAYADLHNRQVKLDEQFVDVKHRLLAASLHAQSKNADSSTDNTGSELFADDHDLDDFYIKFENKFRGTEEEIRDRLRVYVPHFKKLGLDFSKHPVLDIGCGRGELLELLKEEKISAIGLDLNESMVQRCNDRGLKAVQAEALSYLSKQKTGSLGAITGFHIVEHIPFNFLLRLFEECYRVLAPGGIIIFETPNPESLHVGSYAFYFDPSHLHPLVPDVLAFAVENRGFDHVEILRLHPKGDGKEATDRKDPYVNEVVRRFYLEQDYSVIGQKKA